MYLSLYIVNLALLVGNIHSYTNDDIVAEADMALKSGKNVQCFSECLTGSYIHPSKWCLQLNDSALQQMCGCEEKPNKQTEFITCDMPDTTEYTKFMMGAEKCSGGQSFREIWLSACSPGGPPPGGPPPGGPPPGGPPPDGPPPGGAPPGGPPPSGPFNDGPPPGSRLYRYVRQQGGQSPGGSPSGGPPPGRPPPPPPPPPSLLPCIDTNKLACSFGVIKQECPKFHSVYVKVLTKVHEAMKDGEEADCIGKKLEMLKNPTDLSSGKAHHASRFMQAIVVMITMRSM